MSILDWFKRTGQKKQRAEPIALVAPWRREVLGVIYCSDVCYENAGRGMLASHGKSKPCCFCQTEVTYGHSGIVYMPFLTEPNLVCAKCHEKAEHWNATQKECALCGKACDARPVTTADNSNKIQNSVSSTEANLFQEAMRLYRQSQPQYEPDSLSFPSFNKEKLAKAFESFFDCHGIDASLMKAQCIYDEGSSSGDYGPTMLGIAMNNIDLAIQKNPNNPRAFDIRGSVFYAMYSKDDKEKALELAIENGKKALELDPQYSSDFGTRISTRATTNTAFREDLNGLERSLEELRLEKQLPAEAQEETRLPNNRIESNEEIGNGSMQTAEGKAAYQLAGEIAETRAVHRWKELMDLYYASKSPAAKIEVVRIASSLALASDILEWKMEVNLKANELKQMGQMDISD